MPLYAPPGGGITNAQLTTAVGGVQWTVVTKALDESVTSSTTLQADDELKFTPVSGGLYEVEMIVVYASPAGAGTPDLLINFGEDGTARGTFLVNGFTVADAPANTAMTGDVGVASVTRGTAATNRATVVWGWYIGTGAVAGLFWAQNTSDPNPTTVRAGSVLRYRRIF